MIHNDKDNSEDYKAVYSQTTRGKEQLLFCGQPFIYEKCVRMPNGEMKKFWRCNQWCGTQTNFSKQDSHITWTPANNLKFCVGFLVKQVEQTVQIARIHTWRCYNCSQPFPYARRCDPSQKASGQKANRCGQRLFGYGLFATGKWQKGDIRGWRRNHVLHHLWG